MGIRSRRGGDSAIHSTCLFGLTTFAGLAVVLLLSRFLAAEETPGGFLLGFDDRQPTVYVPAQDGLVVHITEIRYDSTGYVAGYRQEIVAAGRTTRLTITCDPTLKPTEPASLRYTAEVDGKSTPSPTLAEWEKSESRGLLGFSPKDLGGVILRVEGALEGGFTSRLAYDDVGRRMLAAQEFVYQGVKHVVTFSGYTFDGFGRLSAYSAMVRLER